MFSHFHPTHQKASSPVHASTCTFYLPIYFLPTDQPHWLLPKVATFSSFSWSPPLPLPTVGQTPPPKDYNPLATVPPLTTQLSTYQKPSSHPKPLLPRTSTKFYFPPKVSTQTLNPSSDSKELLAMAAVL